MWLGTGNLSMVSLETSFQLSFARNKNAFFFWKMPISAFETLIKKLNKIKNKSLKTYVIYFLKV
jgi:hypothetical protein